MTVTGMEVGAQVIREPDAYHAFGQVSCEVVHEVHEIIISLEGAHAGSILIIILLCTYIFVLCCALYGTRG